MITSAKKLLMPVTAALLALCLWVGSLGYAQTTRAEEGAPAAPTSAPAASPSPASAPAATTTSRGLLGHREDVFNYSGTPVQNQEVYISDQLSIRITRRTDNPFHAKKLVYYVADIYLQDISSLRTEAARGFLSSDHRPMMEVAGRVGAILAVNGDYYAARLNSLVIRNGQVYRMKPHMDRTRDVCFLYRDGSMEVVKAKDVNLEELDIGRIWQAWQFGPYLIEADGSPRTDFKGVDNQQLNPRTVLGYYEPGHYCIVVVDGRDPQWSKGLTLDQLAQLMADLGCTQAYNMDGGHTCQMYWQEAIFNKPSALRSQVDIIYLVEPVGDAAE